MKRFDHLLSRADDSILARWWWTVDRFLLVLVVLLIAIGLLLSFAASPAVAERLGLSPFHFAIRQSVFAGISLVVLLGVSLLDRRDARRVGVFVGLAGLVLVAMTLIVGETAKGASRWLDLGPVALQPSEFLKPGLIVMSAWLLAGAMHERRFPGLSLSLLLMMAAAALLLAQPDVGQTLLLGTAFSIQLLIFGVPFAWLGGIVAAVGGLLIGAYFIFPHVAQRIDAFLASGPEGHLYQVATALRALAVGGLFGRGPGEGMVKKVLPDAHTDFIFAAAGEEYGALAGIILLALYALLVLRTLTHLLEEDDPFVVLAAGGLVSIVGLQAAINIGVNLALLPPKGMTLPFISYGGSSLVASAFTIGLVLAFTRSARPRRAGLTAGMMRRVRA
ncbi:MAG: cell division protein FtsW [Alphaproteobacteria bacterium]|nr:MAG: cell division protein FtsW [Alphaproteobacteria bacterium]